MTDELKEAMEAKPKYVLGKHLRESEKHFDQITKQIWGVAEVQYSTDYDTLKAEVERKSQALEMMDDWFGDQMTQNQVDIINMILGGK